MINVVDTGDAVAASDRIPFLFLYTYEYACIAYAKERRKQQNHGSWSIRLNFKCSV